MHPKGPSTFWVHLFTLVFFNLKFHETFQLYLSPIRKVCLFMKNLLSALFLIVLLLFSAEIGAKTIHVPQPGTLSSLLTAEEQRTVTELTLTGSIDARDFLYMRKIPLLSVLDLSEVKITEYSGVGGTDTIRNITYPADRIPTLAFYDQRGYINNTMLTTVVFPKNLIGIGSYAFARCIALKKVDLPMSVMQIGDWAFQNATGLTEVNIPNCKTTNDYYGFSGCTNIVQATAPSNFFSSSTKLSTFTFTEGVTNIRIQCFSGKSSLTSVTIPTSVTNIEQEAFYKCTALKSIQLPSDLIQLGNYAFSECSGLKEVALPGKLKTLGEGVFFNCPATISVDPANTHFSTQDSVLYDAGKQTVILCPRTKSGLFQLLPSVERIASSAFYGCTKIDSLTIPKSLKYIERYAFYGCIGLKRIEFPEGLDSIQNNAFASCTGLTNVQLPAGIRYMDANAFYFCTALTSVTTPYAYVNGTNLFQSSSLLTNVRLPEGQTSIRNQAFFGMSKLTSLVLPASVQSIGNSAFTNCSAVTAFNLSAKVNYIGDNAFQNCTSATINIDSTNPWFSMENGVLYNSDKTLLINYPASRVGSFEIPSTVRALGAASFSKCTGLSAVTLPSTLKSIRANTFAGCTALLAIQFPAALDSIGNNAFYGCTTLTEVTIPEHLRYFGSATFNNCTGLVTLTASQGSSARFNGCTKLTSIVVPEGVTELMDSSFVGMSTVTSVKLPRSLKKIGYRCFSSCTKLASITLPDSVEQVDAFAFATCSLLRRVKLSEALRTIGSGAFTSCSLLDSLKLTRNLKLLGERAFQSCTALHVLVDPANTDFAVEENVLYDASKKTLYFYPYFKSGNFNVPATVECIREAAFVNCIKMTAVNFPPSLKSIRSSAFAGCTKLTSVVLPAALDSLHTTAFLSCTSLTEAVIPAGVSYLGGSVFSNCTLLKTATTPISIGSKGLYLFYGCNNLRTIHVPEGTVHLDDKAFVNMYNLLKVTLPTTLESIGACAFQDCGGVDTIRIPGSVQVVGDGAFSGCSAVIVLDPTNTDFTTEQGVLYNAPKTVLLSCPTFKAGSLVLPSTVKSIRAKAFQNCKLLTSIQFPNTLDTIGAEAFQVCTGLKEICIPSTINYVGENAFAECSNLTKATTPFCDFIGDAYYYDLFNMCNQLDSIIVPDDVTHIKPFSFSNQDFGYIQLPNSLVSIGRGAFRYDLYLREIRIPATVKQIEEGAFAVCNAKISVDQSNPWFVVDDGVLYNSDKTRLIACSTSKIGTFRIPDTVVHLDEACISICNSLTSIEIPASVTEISPFAITYCQNLESIRMLSAKPAALTDTMTWFNVDTEKCILYVPANAVETYRNTPVWNNFKQILADTLLVSTTVEVAPKFSLTPNPASDRVQIQGVGGQLSVYDMNGRLVRNQSIEANGSLDVRPLKSGVYLVRLQTKQGPYQQKLIKK